MGPCGTCAHDFGSRRCKRAQHQVANARNKSGKSALKTDIKKFDAAVLEGNREAADAAYRAAVKSVDQAVNKGLLHKNTAARKKSSMTLKLNKLA